MSERRRLRRGALAGLALLLATAGVASGAGVTAAARKPAEPATAGGVAVAHGDFAATASGERSLLVTFADRPAGPEARRRLSGLGAVAPLVPEAGVWDLAPSRPASARAAVLGRARVSGAEWSLARRAADRPPPPAAPGPAPVLTDPLFTPASQWGLLERGSWSPALTTTGPRAPIAILDSGVDPTHEEWGGPQGPLVAPRSVLRGDDDASDHGESGHGTHVAGIAAAPANGVGIVGVAPGSFGTAPVIPVQIANRAGYSTDTTMIRGVRHAVLNGAKVINISAGGRGYSRAFQDTILWATQRGALIVASVGNQGQDINTLNYPAAYRRVLGVGAQCDGAVSFDCPRPYGVATFSTYNRSVDVIAPGVRVLSSVPRRVTERVVTPGYALKDGTSMAAPYVAGVASLVQGANGNALSPFQVLTQITNTATDIGRRGRDDTSGHGVVNPGAAVTLNAPEDDPGEVNDDVKWLAGVTRLGETGRPVEIDAAVDSVEDPDDVYAVRLARGERLRVTLTRRRGQFDLYVWNTGTRTVATGDVNLARHLVRYKRGSSRPGVAVYRAERAGIHYVNVFARRGAGPYTLRLVRGG
ncbi:S8 family peptidase [Miltoncostaea oceani]|uniref:S8 family peptidase n=1 Tax=Miltoncostaea oceani TaxID=2843216 RepID=UPI001C3C8093|nr:S8 family serine peptidase [Miltoncostaea oceani]